MLNSARPQERWHMTQEQFLSWLRRNQENLLTPSYIYSELMLDAALAELRALFPGTPRVFYSLKANPQPVIVNFLAGLEVGAEIASPGELRMCEVAELTGPQILVGGVSKSAEYLAAACDRGSAAIVLDSAAEWIRLTGVLSANRSARVLLRVNPGIALGGLDMAGESQFGLDVETARSIALECEAHPNVDFLGLHFYFGSQRLSAEPVVEMVRVAGKVLTAFAAAGIGVRTVDIGLGCGVPYLDKDPELSMIQLRDQLLPLWNSPPWTGIQLWTEAGRALVGRSGYFVARVLERKVQNGKVFVFLDGGLNVHNPGVSVGRFFRSNPRFMFVRRDGESVAGPTESVDIVGNLCTSADSLGRKVNAPTLEEGDLVVIPNSGAYCQTTGLWGFNSQPLFHEAILSHDGKLRYVEPQYRVLLNARG